VVVGIGEEVAKRNKLVEHYECYLDQMAGGWEKNPSSIFRVIYFEKGPIDRTGVVATLGLSNTPLPIGKSERTVRLELVMVFRHEIGPQNLPSVLEQVGTEALFRGRAYLCGDVIGPRGLLIKDGTVSALYVAMPVYFPEGFETVHIEGEDPIVIAWLVPITEAEANFVRTEGSSAFENKLEEYDPDLLDFQRKSII
jgi:hypothetical protein